MTITNKIKKITKYYKSESSPSSGDKIIIADTTLRDGEQAPGCSMSVADKVIIAGQLVEHGVDIIEAGFAANQNGGFESVSRVADKYGSIEGGPIISTLARCNEDDIRAARRAMGNAKNTMIHAFIATSDIHLEYKLKKTRAEVLKKITEMVGFASSEFKIVQFSAEDATRSEPEYLMESFFTAIEAGATIINVPDTVGYMLPDEYGQLIKFIYEELNSKGYNHVRISTHTHNDLYNAVPNAIAGVKNGARQVEGTINGIGERAGNADLNGIIATFKTRTDRFRKILGRADNDNSPITNIKSTSTHSTSKVVERYTIPIDRKQPIVGANAFAHESGIHQDGASKNKSTYEIMQREDYGIPESVPTISRNSGTAGFVKMGEFCGVYFDDFEVKEKCAKFFEFVDQKAAKSVTPFDFMYWYTTPEILQRNWKLQNFDFSVKDTSPTEAVCSATIILEEKKDQVSAVESANSHKGPVDASIKAVNKIIGIYPIDPIFDFKVNPSDHGSDGEVTVKVTFEVNNRKSYGTSRDKDTVIAATEAYIDAINRHLS
jgi:2-isopropylmalate synthase